MSASSNNMLLAGGRIGRPEDRIGHTVWGGVAPLPSWAKYLVALGRFCIDHRVQDRRIVVGVSLPIRAFAAALVALGVAYAAYDDPAKRDAREYFEWLRSLAPGTLIRFARGQFLYCATLLGVEVRSGMDYLAYKDEATTYYIPWNRCGGVAPLEPGQVFIRRRPLAANARFVEAVFGIDALAHASHTSLDCLIVGVKSALREELVHNAFVATSPDGCQVEGVLNDLLRCDAFEVNANDHDRTTIISPSTDDIAERLRTTTPPAVVFDGASGYLRLRAKWRRSSQILLLDRSSPSAAAAGMAFDQELAMSIDDVDLSMLGEPPRELEVCAFYEALR